MTDLEKHVNQPGRDKLVKKVREKINEEQASQLYKVSKEVVRMRIGVTGAKKRVRRR